MVTRCLLLALLLAACRTAPQVPEDLFLQCVEMRSEALMARANWGTKLERRFLDKNAEITAHLTATPSSYSDVVQMIKKDRELIADLAELLTEVADMEIKSGKEVTACEPVFKHLYDHFR